MTGQQRVAGAVRWLAAAMAMLGGLLFVIQASISVVSIVGRVLWSQPIPGDYDLVQLLSASAVALCLPWCQVSAGHVIVDVFSRRLPHGLRQRLDRWAAVVIALIAALLAGTTTVGLLDMHGFQETSMVIGLPIWWGYAVLVPSFAVLALAALAGAFERPAR